MGWKIFLSFVFILFAISTLVLYWFVPFKTTEFGVKPGNSNFSLGSYEEGNMQFYTNMRYPDSKISYKIDSCPLQKKDDMERAFEIISNKSILEFYPLENNEEISVTCDSRNKIKDGLFIAGEGGPTNIIKAGEFNVIFHGKVLLIKESTCERPNIALHELLHALGFDHSENPDNIMYYLAGCEKTIGQDQIDLINKLYSVPSYPDLAFENASAILHGRYLDTNITVKNNGLKDAEEVKILIYADEKFVKEIDLDSLKIGYGITISLSNVWVKVINVRELKFVIDYDFDELEKNNNEIVLEIKN